MEIWFLIALIFVIFFVAKVLLKPEDHVSARTVRNEAVADEKPKAKETKWPPDWLEEKWDLASDTEQAKQSGLFPRWYFDEVTSSQLRKINELDVKLGDPDISKGQASDLIGLFYPVDENDKQVLRFFKVPLKGLNQSSAIYEVAKLLQDDENKERWNNRPPTARQKAGLEHFGIKKTKGMTYSRAAGLINSAIHDGESEEEENRAEKWAAFEDIADEFSDPDFRETYEIKRPSFTLLKQALSELNEAGKTYSDLRDDIDEVVEKLMELKPELEK